VFTARYGLIAYIKRIAFSVLYGSQNRQRLLPSFAKGTQFRTYQTARCHIPTILWNVALYSWSIQTKLCERHPAPHLPNCTVSHPHNTSSHMGNMRFSGRYDVGSDKVHSGRPVITFRFTPLPPNNPCNHWTEGTVGPESRYGRFL
jgi:hypothetical protein